jgi:hypothetical protein
VSDAKEIVKKRPLKTIQFPANGGYGLKSTQYGQTSKRNKYPFEPAIKAHTNPLHDDATPNDK